LSKEAAGGDRTILWVRSAFIGGFAVAGLALAYHSRCAWLYFQPSVKDWAVLVPNLGPFWAAEWTRHTLRIAEAGLFFLSLPGLGRLAAPRRSLSSFEAAGLGLIVWGFLGFFLAAAGLCRPNILKGVSVGLALLGGAVSLKNRDDRAFRLPRSPSLKIAAALFCGLYLLTTLVPETFYDALVYHLAAPQAWLQAGRMTDMPDIHLWRLPGLMQPLYMWGLAWSDERLCKLMNVGIAFLAAGHLNRWAGNRWGRAAGEWSAVLFLSCPMVAVNSWSCANDVPAGFLALLALTRWLDSRREGEGGDIFLAGLLFGAAAATKTTALFAAPFYLIDSFLSRRSRGGAARLLLLFAAGATLPILPWMVRAWAWTGNPFYPHAASLLGGDRPENIALLKSWHAEMGAGEPLLSRLIALLRDSLTGIEAGRFGFVGPVLLMLLPLAFFLKPDATLGSMGGYGLLAYALFLTQTGRLRYFLPHLPALFALAGASLADYTVAAETFRGRIVPRLGRLIRSLAGVAVALNLLWLVLVFGRFHNGWPVVWGQKSAADYLRAEHYGVYGHPSQGAFDWMRGHGARGRLFLIGDARTFRSPIPARASASFNIPLYALWAGDPPAAERLRDRLRSERFTYLLVNVEELKRVTPDPYKSPTYLRALGSLFDSFAPPLYRDPWCILFAVPTS
jgi:hypothetical protein